MAIRDGALEQARELLQAAGPITHRKMFGGAGLYVDGVIFAILLRDEIFLKADEALGAEIEEAGGERWVYARESRDGAETAMPYWRLPDSAYDDPDEAGAWAVKALEAAKALAAASGGKSRARKKRAG